MFILFTWVALQVLWRACGSHRHLAGINCYFLPYQFGDQTQVIELSSSIYWAIPPSWYIILTRGRVNVHLFHNGRIWTDSEWSGKGEKASRVCASPAKTLGKGETGLRLPSNVFANLLEGPDWTYCPCPVQITRTRTVCDEAKMNSLLRSLSLAEINSIPR